MKGMMKMAENRRRSETLTVRLTKAEKASIIVKSKKAKMTLTEYILAISKDTKIVLPTDTAPIVVELKRIGNNLNQITAKINTGVFQSYDFQDGVDEQRKIYEQLLKIARKG